MKGSLKILVNLLIVLPCLVSGQLNYIDFIGTYSLTADESIYKLDINKDSTFIFKQFYKHDSTRSEGNWKYFNDTVILFNYQTPWSISSVREKIDPSLKNKILLELIVGDTNSINIRGDFVYYIDGNPTSVKYDYSQGIFKVIDFDVWIDDNCNNKRKTNDKGIATFHQNIIKKISIDYDEYIISCNKCNHFIVTLTNAPVIFSPPILQWAKWKINKNKLMPIECGKLLDYIDLEK